jgi:hypothetical protein
MSAAEKPEAVLRLLATKQTYQVVSVSLTLVTLTPSPRFAACVCCCLIPYLQLAAVTSTGSLLS